MASLVGVLIVNIFRLMPLWFLVRLSDLSENRVPIKAQLYGLPGTRTRLSL